MKLDQHECCHSSFFQDINLALPLEFLNVGLHTALLTSFSLPLSWQKDKKTLFEIIYQLEGKQVAVINGISFDVEKGDILFLCPEDDLTLNKEVDDCCSYLNVYFQTDEAQLFTQMRESRYVINRREGAVAQQISFYLAKLVDLSYRPDKSNLQLKLMMHALLYEILSKLIGMIHHGAASTQRLKNDDQGYLAQFVAERLKSMLSNSLLNHDTTPERISITGIAAEFGVSNSHCNRVFKSVYQVSPRQYLSQLIVQTAKTLLDQSDLKIVRISQLLGYGDPINFSKQFKKWTGVSPRDFRNRSGVKKIVI